MSDIENTVTENKSTADNGDSVKIIICPSCGKVPCQCNEFVCPKHGRVKAKLVGKTERKISGNDPKNPNKIKVETVHYDDYCCSIEDCDVHRILSEMEYPHRNE